jgi:hypothetical protein
MIQLTAQMRILVAVEPVDFRRGIDGLCRLCRQSLSQDPFSGAVFVFRNRRGTGTSRCTGPVDPGDAAPKTSRSTRSAALGR